MSPSAPADCDSVRAQPGSGGDAGSGGCVIAVVLDQEASVIGGEPGNPGAGGGADAQSGLNASTSQSGNQGKGGTSGRVLVGLACEGSLIHVRPNPERPSMVLFAASGSIIVASQAGDVRVLATDGNFTLQLPGGTQTMSAHSAQDAHEVDAAIQEFADALNSSPKEVTDRLQHALGSKRSKLLFTR
jgi:hypothetical protein